MEITKNPTTVYWINSPEALRWCVFRYISNVYPKPGLSKHVNAVGPIFGPARGEMGPNMKILKKISKKFKKFSKILKKISKNFLKKFAKNEKTLWIFLKKIVQNALI